MWVVRVVFGVLYVLAGIAKAFPQIEDVGQVLARAAEANAGTILAGPSDWLAANSGLVTVFVGVALFVSGLCYLLNRLVIPAAIGQMLMLICFMAILHQAIWQVLVIDTVFFAVAVLVIREAMGRRQAAVPEPSRA